MTLAIVYANFAPFHLARLQATGVLGHQNGHVLHGIEIAGSDESYKWSRAPRFNLSFISHTLFPHRDLGTLAGRSIQKALDRKLNSLQPEVVIVPGWTSPGLAALGWCLRNQVARVLVSDSQEIDRPQQPFKTAIKRVLVARFQAAFPAGEPHRRWLKKLGVSDDICLTGCDVVDNGAFTRVRRDTEPYGETTPLTPVLLSCLRLVPEKNVVWTLECIARREFPWTWIIAGDGPLRQRIMESIEKLGLSGKVRLIGHMPYAQLPALYASADIYFQPSISEPWALSVNEAMASGLPVLVSNRCGCHEDLVHEGVNGFTFNPLDPGSLYSALKRLADVRNAWPNMGRQSEEIISKWGLDKFAANAWRASTIALTSRRNTRLRATDRALGAVL